MRYRRPDSTLFIENRTRLRDVLPPRAAVILHSNDIPATNGDSVLPFVQNSDLFYLTGIDQEETVLILFPDAPDEAHREMLFLKETSEQIAIWEGAKLTKDGAQDVSGIKNVHWTAPFDSLLRTVMKQADTVYLSTNEHTRATGETETRNLRFIRRCQHQFPLHDYRRLSPLTEMLRSIKSEAEISLLRTACEITEAAFRRALAFIRPGVTEYEIEAEYAHEFIRRGASGFAYDPIIASGQNACVLHYTTNDQTCGDGDMLLMDVGARYANYNADLTRCVPVNGRFTDRQRAVYEAVLRVHRTASRMLRPGVILKNYQGDVGKLMESELVGLGLLDRDKIKDQDPGQPLYKKYFMHGTSHHLGIDVHDAGNTNEPLQAGMVFTVEPGIYIREENLGIRIENNFVIGERENIDLMATIPVDPDEIEELMAH